MFANSDARLWGNAETTVTIIAASIPMLRVLVRDVAGSRATRKAYASNDYYKEQSLGTGRHNTRVVAISSGPMTSDIEMAKQTSDDSSDRGILDETHQEAKRGHILQTNDFIIKYDREREER